MTRISPADHGLPYFAAFLDLLRKKVVVVGGGKVATTKIRALLPCGPKPLVVVAPQVSTFIRRAAEAGQLDWRPRGYAAHDLHDAALAFGATDDRALNAQVAADARRLGVAVLAVDDVPNCDFIAPALVRRGDVTVAISTGGRSPALARRTRERLERALPASWGDVLEVAAAQEDPNSYVPGDPKSIDPVLQVSISVIGEGVLQLRGPIKGINIVRRQPCAARRRAVADCAGRRGRAPG